MAVAWRCTYSIGFSMVRMWQARVWLMWPIMAARVVDFPDPVGPVTSTSPDGEVRNLSTTTVGSPSWSRSLPFSPR
jgi:hypothetical protein